MKKVKYVRNVIEPKKLAGIMHDEKELDDEDAEKLAAEGYVEIQEEPKEKGESNPAAAHAKKKHE